MQTEPGRGRSRPEMSRQWAVAAGLPNRGSRVSYRASTRASDKQPHGAET